MSTAVQKTSSKFHSLADYMPHGEYKLLPFRFIRLVVARVGHKKHARDRRDAVLLQHERTGHSRVGNAGAIDHNGVLRPREVFDGRWCGEALP